MKCSKYHSQFTAKGIAPTETSGVYGVEQSYAVFPIHTARDVTRQNGKKFRLIFNEEVVGRFGDTRLRGYIVDMSSLLIVIDYPNDSKYKDSDKESHFLYEACDGKGLYISEAYDIFQHQLKLYTATPK